MSGVNRNITNENYVDEAEKVITNLKNKKNNYGRAVPMVTTSKLRNLLALSADIYNDVMQQNQSEELSSDIRERIEYLKVRIVYEAGREPRVKDFVEESDLLNVVKKIGNKKTGFILFNRYMEALVAFHKYYGGREN